MDARQFAAAAADAALCATTIASSAWACRVAASLSLAGHEVFIVRNFDDLRSQRDEKAPDLILVDAARTAQLQAQAIAGGADGRKGALLLKAVAKALKERSLGLPIACEKHTGSQQA